MCQRRPSCCCDQSSSTLKVNVPSGQDAVFWSSWPILTSTTERNRPTHSHYLGLLLHSHRGPASGETALLRLVGRVSYAHCCPCSFLGRGVLSAWDGGIFRPPMVTPLSHSGCCVTTVPSLDGGVLCNRSHLRLQRLLTSRVCVDVPLKKKHEVRRQV